MSWKVKFSRGQFIKISGETFRIAEIGKRGLMLRHVPNIQQTGSEPRNLTPESVKQNPQCAAEERK